MTSASEKRSEATDNHTDRNTCGRWAPDWPADLRINIHLFCRTLQMSRAMSGMRKQKRAE
jgi:hypothetical protein